MSSTNFLGSNLRLVMNFKKEIVPLATDQMPGISSSTNQKFVMMGGCRGKPNRGYKELNLNPNILSFVFGSDNQSQIAQTQLFVTLYNLKVVF